MKQNKIGCFLVFTVMSIILSSCETEQTVLAKVTVKNDLAVKRMYETVEVDLTSLRTAMDSTQTLAIRNAESGTEVISQAIDVDKNGSMDVLLFQPIVATNSELTFEIYVHEKESVGDSLPRCYSRFVPERTDDYAWENNRVGFRTYGPTAQKMIEDDVPGGTLSSGIDAWLKRVEYSIIDKWYKKYTEGTGTYHEDTGEGLDNFHVGKSRGIGGVAVKNDTTYNFSKNFVSWRTICNGPIRTSFELAYAEWDSGKGMVNETKTISLDYGQNLSRFRVLAEPLDTLSVGMTLHENDGRVTANLDEGWVSYWEPHEDSELGMGVIAPEETMLGYEQFVTDRKDESNVYAHLEGKNSTFVYYAGFGWKKSGQFTTPEAWEAYLKDFALKLKHPLSVKTTISE